jgi:hypothetical protein
LATGLTDKLRFWHILNEELRTYKDVIVKNCTVIKFSQGGQYLAAAYPKIKSTHYVVNVFDSYSLEV